MSFEQWIEKLKRQNPHLNWDSMSEHTIRELREVYEDAIVEKGEE
jgi:hypothetical protein